MNGPSLIGLMLAAPLSALGSDRLTVHAADMEHLARAVDTDDWPSTRCGAPSLGIIPAHTVDGDTVPVLWPPKVRTLPDGFRRCRECMKRGERPREEIAT